MKKTLLLLGVSTTLASVATITLAVAPSQAAILGSVAGSGDADFLTPNTLEFSGVAVGNNAMGIFLSDKNTSVTVQNLTLQNDGSYDAIQNFYQFTSGINFDLDAGTADIFNPNDALVELSLSGTFEDMSNDYLGTGTLNISTSGNSTSMQFTAQAVPEPTTMIGLAVAGGLGAFGVKKKKQSENA